MQSTFLCLYLEQFHYKAQQGMLGSICREAMKRILFLMYEFEGGIMLVLFLIGERKQDNI